VLSLLLCIPGAGIGMLIQGVNISLTCVLGIVSLMGILVRNAIVLLDYAEELRNQGETLRDAIFKASQRRMRPIFLTSAAATMGVVPMVIGGSALWQPMGVVIFYGTPITMIFILTTIPVAYWKMKARQKGANSPLDEPLETHMI
ncbi:MAG: efflux RND transporter permease subunit, partial [Muribaculaceae bacterium]|nr:efflux RND transporter permease subunit [Muribaculaceae bacterium]